MHGDNALARDDASDSIFELTPIDLDAIPAQHPVSIFASRYAEMTDGHFIPDERKLLKDEIVRSVSGWIDHVEPVSLGGHVDFYILSPGETQSNVDPEYMRGTWMSDSMDEGFTASRYHDAVNAAILRTPKFSRGAVPSLARSFMLQYRGVFPMFAENHARLRLAIISAETFIELKRETRDDGETPTEPSE